MRNGGMAAKRRDDEQSLPLQSALARAVIVYKLLNLSCRLNHLHHIVHITIVQLEQYMVFMKLLQLTLAPEVHLTIVRVADDKAVQSDAVVT